MNKKKEKQFQQIPHSIVMTIKRLRNTNLYKIHELDPLKTRKTSMKQNKPLIPILNIQEKYQENSHTQTYHQSKQIQQKQSRYATQRNKQYRIRKIGEGLKLSKGDKFGRQELSQFNTPIPLLQQLTSSKLNSERRVRKHPQCRIIKSKHIPFNICLRKQSQQNSIEQASLISQIIKNQQEPFISFESYKYLQL